MIMTMFYCRIFFEDEKPFVLLKLPFCEQIELKINDFIKKFHNLPIAILG